MAVVVTDLVERSSASNTVRGWEVDRTFHIEGLDGDETKKLYDAGTAPGVPHYGDPHPTIPDIKVESLQIEPSGSFSAYVVVHYANLFAFRGFGTPERAVIEVSGSIVSTRATTHRNGKEIKIQTAPASAQGGIPEVNGTVDVFEPQATFTYTRREIGDPGDKALRYVNSVNGSPFRGKPRWTWLCTNITGRSIDGGTIFDVTYSFQYNPGLPPWNRGWQPIAVNYENGKVPDNAQPDPTQLEMIQYTLVDYYREENFNVLGLE